jgi:hypothetical protein
MLQFYAVFRGVSATFVSFPVLHWVTFLSEKKKGHHHLSDHQSQTAKLGLEEQWFETISNKPFFSYFILALESHTHHCLWFFQGCLRKLFNPLVFRDCVALCHPDEIFRKPKVGSKHLNQTHNTPSSGPSAIPNRSLCQI